MAALTWRNVEGPNFDMRSMFQATQGLDSTFGRFGDILNQREEKLRTDATDAALAQGYAAQDPEAVAALMAKGVGGMGPRVNGRAFMEAMAKYKSDLVDSGYKNEQRLTLKDDAEHGSTYASYFDNLTMGKRAEADALVAANANFRNWGKYAAAGNDAYAGYETRKETRDNNLRQDENTDLSRKQAGEIAFAQLADARAARAANAALTREGWNRQDKARNADRDEERMLTGIGSQMGAALPLTTDKGELDTIIKTQLQKQGIPQYQWNSIVRGATDAFTVRTTPTRDDLSRQVGGIPRSYGAGVPGTNGMPAFMLPGSPEGKRALSPVAFAPNYLTGGSDPVASKGVGQHIVERDRALSQTSRDMEYLTKDFYEKKPEFAAYTNVDKYKDTTPKEFIEAAGARGLTESTANKALARGMTSSEAMALLKQDLYREDKASSFLSDGYTREKTFESAVDKYIKEKPMFSVYQQELEDRINPSKELILQAMAMRNRVTQSAAGDEGPSMADILLMRRLAEQARKGSENLRPTRAGK